MAIFKYDFYWGNFFRSYGKSLNSKGGVFEEEMVILEFLNANLKWKISISYGNIFGQNKKDLSCHGAA